MVTVAILYMHSIIDGLMWVNFEQKCVKLYTFSILHLLRRLLLYWAYTNFYYTKVVNGKR